MQAHREIAKLKASMARIHLEASRIMLTTAPSRTIRGKGL